MTSFTNRIFLQHSRTSLYVITTQSSRRFLLNYRRHVQRQSCILEKLQTPLLCFPKKYKRSRDSLFLPIFTLQENFDILPFIIHHHTSAYIIMKQTTLFVILLKLITLCSASKFIYL